MNEMWFNAWNPFKGSFVWFLLSCFVSCLLLKHEAEASSGARDSHRGALLKFLFAQEFRRLLCDKCKRVSTGYNEKKYF